MKSRDTELTNQQWLRYTLNYTVDQVSGEHREQVLSLNR